MKKYSKEQIARFAGEFAVLTLAALLLSVGVYVFKYPNNFTFGGVSGISVLLAKIIPVTPGSINLAINMALLLVGLLVFGKDFARKTIYVTILYSFAISLMEKFFPMAGPLTDEPVLELVFAILLPGVSAALLFNMEASSGGTDIVAMLLKKYTSLNIGTALGIVDCVIAVSSFVVFDVTTGLFALVGLLAKSFLIDNVIESINQCKYFQIICSQPDPICRFICDELGRSATVSQATGAFTQQRKYIVLTALRRSQAVQLRNFIKKQEPGAFLLITNTSEIIGKGFRGIN